MTNMSIEALPDIIDAKAIAGVLSIGYAKALRLIKYSGIPYMKIGNTYRIYKHHFINWVTSDAVQTLDTY